MEKKKKKNLEASRTEVSLDVVKDEVPPAIESWSVVIRCCEGWSVAGDRELKHRDWNWSIAGQSRRVAGVWIVAIGSELKRCQCLKRRDHEVKRCRRLRWSVIIRISNDDDGVLGFGRGWAGFLLGMKKAMMWMINGIGK